MPIVQVPLDVPDDIYAGVLNGTLELMGLAKDSQHKVRKHIARANVPKVNKATQAKKVGVLQVVKEHKFVAIRRAFPQSWWWRNLSHGAESSC